MAKKAPLNHSEVMTAALELLDEVGLRRFTMQALADRLKTYPATIYWHVGSRTEVLTAVMSSSLKKSCTRCAIQSLHLGTTG
jgi:TetR/AcrR family tetracycline transcriptional repressor